MGFHFRSLPLWALLPLSLGLPLVRAESPPLATCRSEISYKWAQPGKDERVVFFAMVEQAAPSVEEAKGALAEEVARVKARAHERCKDLHQNLSGCISSRYAAHSATMASLGFKARRSLEEAILTDCTGEQGSCGAVSASEPECREPPKAEEQGAEGEEKKPEGGGKKKK